MHVQQFVNQFVGRANDFARQRSDGGYVRVGRPLTDADISAHLRGLWTLGSYVTNERGQCKYAVFDADGENGLKRLAELQTILAEMGIPSYLETSRRGGHLWVFLAAPALASVVRGWLLPLCPIGVEFYPKQAESVGYGSLIRLPLGVHRKSGQRYPFVAWEHERGLVPVARTVHSTLSWLATVKLANVPALVCVPPTPINVSPPRTHTTSFSKTTHKTARAFPATIRAWSANQDPAQLIGRYVDLNAAGVGNCPFGEHHTQGKDTHASFKVYQPGTPGGYCWYCYVWQQGGSVFDFLRYWYGLDAREMWRRLQTEYSYESV